MFLLIFASEGINGTICAEKNVIDIVINLINKYADNRNLNIKVNFSKNKVFKKLKIKIKKEIVTMGVPKINPSEDNGTYINSADWNNLIKNQNKNKIKFKRLKIKQNRILRFYVSFSYFSPPGCKILHVLTSDSDSLSKTVYIATWIGLESQIWAKIRQIKKQNVFINFCK